MKRSELERVYEAVAADLFAYVDRVSGHAADAEDVLQESFARLLGSEISGENETDARKYVFRIATNIMRDRWRWTRRWRFAEMPEVTGRAPENRYLAEIDAQRALAKLKPKQRQLLWLAYVEGLPHKDISEILGLAPTSVRVLLARARNHLLKKLGKDAP